MVDTNSGSQPDRRLSSWKEIAAFFGRDERTGKRWETVRGLPVRRVPRGTRSSVFAYQRELEDWLHGTGPAVAADAASDSRAASRLTMALASLAVILALSLGVAVTWFNVIGPPGVRSSHVPPAAAAELYAQGVVDWNSRTAAGFDRARDEFTQATTIDPQFAAAFAGLANVYNLISQYTDAPAAASYARARVAAERAIALEPQLAEGYAALGFNSFYADHQFAQSAALFDKALALEPNSAQTLHWTALTGMHMGAFERPLQLIDRAQQLAPDSRAIAANRALILFYAGHADEAVAALNTLRQAAPDYLATPSYLASIYFALGRYELFLDAYRQAAEVAGDAAQLAVAERARQGFAESGAKGLLQAMLDAQRAQYKAGATPAYDVAITAARAGDLSGALDLLEAAVSRGETGIIAMRIEEAFVPLHADARFRALLTKVGLPLPA
jgi:tetratricopeptide (TPR) repeat protein